MAIKFTGKKKPFDCVIADDPPHSAERGRWSDGYWADVCARHMEIFKKNAKALKTKKDPVWFLKSKKETTKP
jgi:hypothetical protein